MKDKYFAIRYQANGKRQEEGVGWATEGWSAKKDVPLSPTAWNVFTRRSKIRQINIATVFEWQAASTFKHILDTGRETRQDKKFAL